MENVEARIVLVEVRCDNSANLRNAGWSSPVARRAQYNAIRMHTKQRGDIAEQAAILEALKRGWSVLRPIGDCLPYDLVFDVAGRFVKAQVKCAWFDTPSQNYVVDNRRTKTNRRAMIREEYTASDFDFALVYLQQKSIFYVYPIGVFISFGSEIHMVEAERRQRRPRSSAYRDAWDLIAPWALQEEILVGTPVKVGEAVSRVIPSQALQNSRNF